MVLLLIELIRFLARIRPRVVSRCENDWQWLQKMWLTWWCHRLNMTDSDLAKYELLTTTILQRRHCDDDSGSNAGLTHLHNARCNMPGPGSLHGVGTRVDTLRPHIVRWCLEYMWQYIVRTNGVGRYPCRRGKKTAEMSQCQPHFYIFGGFVPILLTDLGQIWQETVDLRSTLTCQISFESVYCCLLYTSPSPRD